MSRPRALNSARGTDPPAPPSSGGSGRAVAGARRAAPVAIAAALLAVVVGIRACAIDPPGTGLAAGARMPGDPPDAVVREGSIYLARGGPYLLGVQTSAPARLLVAGHEILALPTRCKPLPAPPELDCLGVSRSRIVLDAGVVPIRLAGPADARLVWSPPGRRGDPEYVPASSLDPRPPDRARFDPDRAGRAVGDGVLALAIGAILLGLAAWYLRRRWWRAPRPLAIAALAVFVAAAAVRLYDLGGAGQTWDEDVNWAAGRNYVSNVLAVDVDQRSWIWNYEHPPVMKYIAGTGAQLADGFGPARALSALAGAAACALLVLIGARLYRLRVGALAGAIAALTPHLIAHAKVVGHESPSVLWWTLGIWLALTAHDPPPEEEPAESKRRLALRLVGIGLVLGIAIASRFINVLLAPALGGILLATAPPRARLRTAALGASILPIVALVTIVALWPRLWSEPARHLAESWARLGRKHSAEPYLGALTNDPPRTYFLVYLLATAPLGILLGVAAWLARVALRVRTDLGERRAAIVLAIALVAPLLVMLSPVRQDGVRYILPCLAILAVVAAAGFDFVADRVARLRPPFAARAAFPAVAAAVLVYLAIASARIHPYYLDYYGEHAGGPTGVTANRRFETAWWGEGVDRAVDYVNTHAARGARIHRDCIAPNHLAWFRGDLWNTMVTDPRQADWIVAYQPAVRRCPIPLDAVAVYTVDARGAPLAIVYKR